MSRRAHARGKLGRARSGARARVSVRPWWRKDVAARGGVSKRNNTSPLSFALARVLMALRLVQKGRTRRSFVEEKGIEPLTSTTLECTVISANVALYPLR